MSFTFTTIETKRLRLRALTPEVYNYVFTHLSGDELKLFFGVDHDADLQREEKKHKEGLQMSGKSLFLFQLIQKASEKVIGWCGFHTLYTLHRRAEIGYVLTDESSRRKGYMKEALFAVIDYGFDVLNLHRIEAMTSPDNAASQKLLTATGFTQEGLLKEHYYVKDHFEDSIVFGLLKINRNKRLNVKS